MTCYRLKLGKYPTLQGRRTILPLENNVFQDLFHCCGRRKVLPSRLWRNLEINHLTHHAQLRSALCQNDICRPGNVYATSISLHTAGSLDFQKCSVRPLPVCNLHQSEVATSRQHGSKTKVRQHFQFRCNIPHQYFVFRSRAS